MAEAKITLNSPFIRGLASAALTDGLRSVLLFDMSARALHAAAAIWAEMLQVVTKEPVTQVILGATAKEDDIWGKVALPAQGKRLSFVWQSGLLMPPEEDSGWLLVVVPDLTQLSLPAARACVMLMGAEVAHLERHGQRLSWRPKICWLANCASREVGQVSPHLLDRFTLRLAAPPEGSSNRVEALLSAIMEQQSDKRDENSLPEGIKSILESASKRWPEMSEKALDRVLSYFAAAPPERTRRRIALCRLALAQARLAGERQVTANHVDTAVQIIALEDQVDELPSVHDLPERGALQEDELPLTPEEKPSQVPPGNKGLKESLPDLPPPPSSDELRVTVKMTVHEAEPPESFPATSLPADYTPYPEDMALVEREAASLRLSFRGYRASSNERGPIIGVERATAVHDIAIIQSLLAAAKFQPIRREQQKESQEQLYLSPSDLHSYRRAPVPREMLVLLLDYTSLAECDWQPTIIPYLQWSYVQRASICLIQVGAKDAPHELGAQRILMHSILNPRINRALETKAGRATPLAHGLELAHQTIRHALQHGRSRIDSALLLVLSDGRGNVPLEASLTNQLTMPVKRRGIEDALQVAHKISRLTDVERVVLNPQPRQYTDLPHELARVLGATIADLPRLEAIAAEVEDVA